MKVLDPEWVAHADWAHTEAVIYNNKVYADVVDNAIEVLESSNENNEFQRLEGAEEVKELIHIKWDHT